MTGVASVRETVHSFGRGNALVGVITHPTSATAPPVVVLGAGIIHKVGPSRIAVELCRALAHRGHPAFRFDLSGIGDSDRAAEAHLLDSVVMDIRDAIDFVLEASASDGVYLVGFCSGADNALFVTRDDPRVLGLGLFDPTVPKTAGFRRRRMLGKARSARSWGDLLSGRSVWRMLRRRLARPSMRPPGYYGLLTLPPKDFDLAVSGISERGVALLFVLGGGILNYCNSPAQVSEAVPTGFRGDLTAVHWRSDLDHILSTRQQRESLIELVSDWLVHSTSQVSKAS